MLKRKCYLRNLTGMLLTACKCLITLSIWWLNSRHAPSQYTHFCNYFAPFKSNVPFPYNCHLWATYSVTWGRMNYYILVLYHANTRQHCASNTFQNFLFRCSVSSVLSPLSRCNKRACKSISKVFIITYPHYLITPLMSTVRSRFCRSKRSDRTSP